jgi:hypothetical protein
VKFTYILYTSIPFARTYSNVVYFLSRLLTIAAASVSSFPPNTVGADAAMADTKNRRTSVFAAEKRYDDAAQAAAANAAAIGRGGGGGASASDDESEAKDRGSSASGKY